MRPEKSQESERELTGPRIDFRGIVYSIPFGVVLCRDPDYRIVFSNRAFYSTLGFFSAEDVDGTLLTQLVHPEDRVMVDDRLRLILESGATVSACRARLLGQAGRVALVDISVMSVVDYDGVRAVVVGAKDVTEEQRLTRRNLQADKMDTVGRLAGGIAHDFNNLLTAIIGFAHLSTLTEGVDERTVELIGEIQTAAERAAMLTGQLLAFSRKEMLIPQVLNLDDLIRDSESSIRDYAGDDIDLSLELSATGSVDLDPTHMIQALLAMIGNSRDAMPNGGTITISTENVTLDDAHAFRDADAGQGPHVLMRISDNGTGIHPDALPHIFEPFFTTKPVGEGTGLGLSTCHGMIAQSGGHILCDSELGAGSTFSIFLPRVARTVSQGRIFEQPTQPQRNRETVLVVDGDLNARTDTVRELQQLGYLVLAAANGERALIVAENHTASIELLLTEETMPDMTGALLSERLRQTFPNIKVLYAVDRAEHSETAIDITQMMLEKPFAPGALASMVRQTLDTVNGFGSA